MSGNEREVPHEQRHERALLGACQAEVVSARSELHDARRGGKPLDVELLRQNLVAALEAYATTIERSGAPLPHRLRAEMELYRSIRHRS